MTKEELMKLGCTEEIADKVVKGLEGNYIPKTRFNEVNEENKALKKQMGERDTQLETLKKNSTNSEELQAQITALQAANAEQQKAHENEIKKLKLDNAVDAALVAAGAKNAKAVKSLFEIEKLKLGDDGKVSGIEEQLAAVQKSDPYLFNEKPKEQQNKFAGFQPGASPDTPPNGGTDPNNMTYSQLNAYMQQNPNFKLTD